MNFKDGAALIEKKRRGEAKPVSRVTHQVNW